MSSTLFDDEERERNEDEENEIRWKGIVLLVGIIASVGFLSYAIVSKVSIKGRQSGQTEEWTLEGTLSCQQNEKNKKEEVLSPFLLQGHYYSIPSSFPSTFKPPNIIWLYLSPSPSPLQLLNQQNILSFASKTNHTVNMVTRSNYSSFFLKQVSEQIERYIDRAQARKQTFYFPGQNQEYSKMVILLYLLQHYGGVYINDTMTLTEDLTWISIVNKEVYVNQIDDSMPVQFLGFHNPRLSNVLEKITLRGVPVQHYRRTIPALSNHFLVTYPRGTFISTLNKKFKQLLSVEGKQLLNKVTGLKDQDNGYIYQFDSHTRGKLFEIASSLVLLEKQRQYQTLGRQNRLFAIDYFGVRSINQLYFTHKIEEMMDFRTPENTYYHLARIDLSQLELVTGKLRYLVKLAPLKEMQTLLELRSVPSGKGTIFKGSFLEKYLIQNKEEVKQGLIASRQQDKEVWDSLPRRVWIFWGTGINQSSVVHQLCTRRMKDLCSASNFTYQEVTKSTLSQYLDNETMVKIETTLASSPHKIYEQTYSDMARLALLYKYGGIYLDASFILLQNLNWLVNIPQTLPSLIYNRYGKHPQVFMFFNPQYASNIYETTIDRQAKTKKYHDLAYENNFIAAEPKNELILEWLEEFMLYHTLEHSEIKVRFQECGLQKQAWTTQKWSYLYEMDAVKCIMGRKEKQLEGKGGGAGEYYGVWSMNGYNGVQKLRGFANFQNPDTETNHFATIFSQRYVDDILGYPQYLVKFFGEGGHSLSRFIFSKLDQIESQSIVGTKLLKYREPDEYLKVISTDPLLVKNQN